MDQSVHKLIGQKLSKNSLCYVLITCQEATADGNMEVEMTYEGDAALASFLLEDAQRVIHEQDLEKTAGQQKIVSFGG